MSCTTSPIVLSIYGSAQSGSGEDPAVSPMIALTQVS